MCPFYDNDFDIFNQIHFRKIIHPDVMNPESLIQEDKSFQGLIFWVWSLGMELTENLPNSVDSVLGKEKLDNGS